MHNSGMVNKNKTGKKRLLKSLLGGGLLLLAGLATSASSSSADLGASISAPSLQETSTTSSNVPSKKQLVFNTLSGDSIDCTWALCNQRLTLEVLTKMIRPHDTCVEVIDGEKIVDPETTMKVLQSTLPRTLNLVVRNPIIPSFVAYNCGEYEELEEIGFIIFMGYHKKQPLGEKIFLPKGFEAGKTATAHLSPALCYEVDEEAVMMNPLDSEHLRIRKVPLKAAKEASDFVEDYLFGARRSRYWPDEVINKLSRYQLHQLQGFYWHMMQAAAVWNEEKYGKRRFSIPKKEQFGIQLNVLRKLSEDLELNGPSKKFSQQDMARAGVPYLPKGLFFVRGHLLP